MLRGRPGRAVRPPMSPRLGARRRAGPGLRRGRAGVRRTPGAWRSRSSGTRCSEFPADNWWHADVSHAAGARPHVGRGSRTCRPTVDLHPDFGPSYGDGPNYGIPITVVGKKHPKVAGVASTTPPRATTCATRSAATPGSRAAAAPTATGTRSSSTRARAGSTRPTRPGQRRALARRLRRGLVAEEEQAAPRRLDLRRRRRAADPARAAAVERGQEEPDRPRHPVHHRRHLRGTTCGRRATTPAPTTSLDYPPMGARFRLAGVVRRRPGCRPYAQGVVAGDEELRPGPRRQRLAVVLPGRAERRTGRTG